MKAAYARRRVLAGVAIFCGLLHAEHAPAEDARAALDRGDYARAEALYREAVRAAPRSAEALSNLGLALSLEGKSSEAITKFRAALALREMPGTLALLGLNYCRLREYESARPVLQRGRRYFSDTGLLAVLGPCYLEAGEPLDAVEVYELLLERHAAHPEENAAQLARAAWRAARYFTAQLRKATDNTAYLRAIDTARDQASPDARGAMRLALESAPYVRPGMAAGEMSKLLPSHGKEAAFLYILAVTTGEQAMQSYLYCERQFPRSRAFRRLKAELLASQGRIEQAAAEYRTLFRDGTASAEVHHDLAMLYRKQSNWTGMLAECRAELAAAPDDERAEAGISESLQQLGRLEEAARFLRPIADRPAPPEWALSDLAATEEALGQWQHALPLLERVARQSPGNRTVHYRLMRLYKRAGRAEAAEKEAAIFRSLQKPAAER